MVPKVTGDCDLNHTANENYAILFSSIQSTHSFDVLERPCSLQGSFCISARSTTREETWQSTTNQRSTPTTRKFVLRSKKLTYAASMESALTLCSMPTLSLNPAQDRPQSGSLSATRYDVEKIFIHIYIQKF
jgi:hypothetical protein